MNERERPNLRTLRSRHQDTASTSVSSPPVRPSTLPALRRPVPVPPVAPATSPVIESKLAQSADVPTRTRTDPAVAPTENETTAPVKRIRKTHAEIPVEKLGNDGRDKKRIKLPRKNARLTEDDKTMLRAAYVAGWANTYQLAASLGKTYEQKRGRIRDLEVAGYLRADPGAVVKTYGITNAGMMVCGIDSRPLKTPNPSKWSHNNKLASVVINLMRDGHHLTGPDAGTPMTHRDFVTHPKLVIPERTLRQQGGRVDSLVAAQRWKKDCQEILAMEDYPRIEFHKYKFLAMDNEGRAFVEKFWDEFYGGYGSYALIHQNSDYTFKSTYTPDGVMLGPHIVHPDGSVTGGNFGIELEENKKTVLEYVRILKQYLDHPLFAGVVYFTDKPQVRSLVEQAREQFITELRLTRKYENPELIGQHILYIQNVSYLCPTSSIGVFG